MTFNEYLSARGRTVTENETVLMSLADDFIEANIEYCKEPPAEVKEKARFIIAYAYSSNGGGFDDNAFSSGKVITKEGLGSGAIVDEFEIIDKDVLGNNSKSLLKRIGVYNLIKKYLCSGSSSGIGMVVV